MRVLNVAEKPAMARQIAAMLADGPAEALPSPSRFCRNVVLRGSLRGAPAEMVVTSVLGHVREADFGAECGRWAEVPYGALLSRETRLVSVVPRDKADVVRNLAEQARRAAVLLLWTDCDREGEHIGWHVAEVCRAANPRLEVLRARFSSASRADVRAAAASPGPLDMRLVAAAAARAELDLRTGAAFTRMQTLGVRGARPELSRAVVSYGSCQFPTLGFVVAQWARLCAFVPDAFWALRLSLCGEQAGGGAPVRFSWRRGRVYDRLAAGVLFERALEASRIAGGARVASVETRPVARLRPLPLRTVELQKVAARALGMSSAAAMRAAEDLYTAGLISYPRTETDQFPVGFDAAPIVSRLAASGGAWSPYARALIDSAGGLVPPRRGGHDDGAHPPVHPTGAAPARALGANEARLFEFVVRRFLACVSGDARGEATEVCAFLGEEAFDARGVRVTAPNYLGVYPYDKWDGAALDAVFVPGRLYAPADAGVDAGATAPPLLLSEADLIATMDRNGVGTDATIHEHIARIQERRYAAKVRGRFRPTVLGAALVAAYDAAGLDDALTRPALRAHTERLLAAVARGETAADDVVARSLAAFSAALVRVHGRMDALARALAADPAASVYDLAPLPAGVEASAGRGADVSGDDDGSSGSGAGGRGTAPRRKARAGGDSGDDDGNSGGSGPGGSTETTARRKAKAGGRGAARANTRRRGGSASAEGSNAESLGDRPGGKSLGARPKRKTRSTGTTGAPTGSADVVTAPDAPPRCSACGRAAVQRTVVRDGPNTGRVFWACPGDHGFCAWASAAGRHCGRARPLLAQSGGSLSSKSLPSESLPSGSAGNSGTRNTSYPERSGGAGGKRQPRGRSDAAPHKRQYATTVASRGGARTPAHRHGENSGNGRCADAHGPEPPPRRERPAAQFDAGVRCTCNLAVRRIASTRAESAGRVYLRCARVANGCGFFLWEDEVPAL